MLRDCARGSKIWDKAPRVEDIPDSKWATFFQLVKEACPQLGSCKYRQRLRLRLGQALQNRRKYKRDCASGKRLLKSSTRKTTARTVPDISDMDPPVSLRPLSSSSPIPPRPVSPPRALNSPPSSSNQTADDQQFTVGHEVCIYKTTNLKLKLGRGIYMGREDVHDPSGMYSKVQLLAIYNSAMEEEIPLPLENEDGALQLNDVKINSMFCWKTAKLGKPNHPSKQFKSSLCTIEKRLNPEKKHEVSKKKEVPSEKNASAILKKHHISKKRDVPAEQNTPATTLKKHHISKKVPAEQNASAILKNYKGNKITESMKVAVAYDQTFYVGDVTAINTHTKMANINFMARSKDGYFTWPRKKDVSQVYVDFIFATNIELVGEGQSARGGGFLINEDEISSQFEQYKHDYM